MTDNPTPHTVAHVASALALAILRESLAAGKRIEIPALEIVIEPALVGAGDGEEVVDRDKTDDTERK